MNEQTKLEKLPIIDRGLRFVNDHDMVFDVVRVWPDHVESQAVIGAGRLGVSRKLFEEHLLSGKYKVVREVDPSVLQSKMDAFVVAYNALAEEAFAIAASKGWWDEKLEDGTKIALMHSELSEALEASRHGNPADDKIPEFHGVEAELADCIIRIMDFGVGRRHRIAEALVAKMLYNKGREHKHGGKKF